MVQAAKASVRRVSSFRFLCLRCLRRACLTEQAALRFRSPLWRAALRAVCLWCCGAPEVGLRW